MEKTLLKGKKRDTLILCIPGGPGSDSKYMEFMKDIFEFDIILYNYFDSGKESTISEENYSKYYNLKYFTKELKNFIDRLNYERIIIYSHSFGSMLALNYCFYYKNSISGLICITPLVNPERDHKFIIEKARKCYSDEEWNELLDKMKEKDSLDYWEDNMYKFIDKHLYCNINKKRSYSYTINEDMYNYMWGSSEIGFSEDSGLYKSKVNPSKVDTDTLILNGVQGELFEVGEILNKKLINSRRHVISNSAHCPYKENPKEHDKYVKEFVSSII